MRYRIALLVAVLTSALVIGILHTSEAHANSLPRAVNLWDASSPPDVLEYLPRGGSYHPWQCNGDFFSDVSAYRWNGRKLGKQRWNRDHDRTYWRAKHGRVIFDGVTFFNKTRAPVLVAGWCG